MAAPRGVGGGGAGLCRLCMRVGRLVGAGSRGAAAAGWEGVGVVAEGGLDGGRPWRFCVGCLPAGLYVQHVHD